MATYNLNEVLKAKAATEKKSDSDEIKLDDVSRVKVLSPGRQVFKRFIRNRLAVFGSILLITMFVFSFIGPLFYAYGQKQIFYKYDTQTVNYAMAKVNTAYNGFEVDGGVAVERSVNNAMNSNIKDMLAKEETERIVLGSDGLYQIKLLADEIYQLSAGEIDLVCTSGLSKVKVGTYNSLIKTMDFDGEEVEGLAAAAAKNISGNGGEFSYQGVTYTFTKGANKSYTVYAEFEGVNYEGAALNTAFEVALDKAIDEGKASFTVSGHSYGLLAVKDAYEVYRLDTLKAAKVFTRLSVDTYVTGGSLSTEMRVAALLAAAKGGSFTAEGQSWSIREEDEGLYIIYAADGSEYAEMSTFTVRRYTGEDSMAYGLKKAVAATVEDMVESGERSASLVYELPLQDPDTGVYTYDEQGNLLYQESNLLISQRDNGSYVITCDQVIYVIDMFAAPSATHILGTDGDGFDVFARIMYGGRVSLMVGFVVVFLEIFLGVIMGGLAGYFGGWVDMLIMRLVDIFYCLPSMPIMIILGAMMDALRMDTYIRLLIMMAALGIMGWAGVARMVRGQILSLREQEFMVATEATGIKIRDRIFHHLIPNVMPQLIVIATMGMGSVILTESTLSYLGLGVKHPLATWGTIINSVSSSTAMKLYPFIWIPVGLLICLTVIAFNFVGDGLRDAYDPKAKR